MTVYRNKQRQNEWRYTFYLSKERFSGLCLDEEGRPVTTKSAARAVEERERLAARQKQNLAKTGVQVGSYTIGQAAALHLTRKEGKTDFENHVRYVREILNFKAFANGAKPMKDITAEDIEAYRKFATTQTLKKWIGGPRRESYSPSRRLWKDSGRPRSKREVNNYLKCLRALLAIGEKTRDPLTRLPVVDGQFEVRLFKMPKRIPRPISDDELHARLDNAKPWTRECAELARLFGLRLSEALKLQLRHIDREAHGLRFDAGDTKSGNDEWAFGGDAGWQLLLNLEAQALARGQAHLVTWPGRKKWRRWLGGEPVDNADWVPLTGITRSWKTSARAAGIQQPRRFHDVRARYITEVAKVHPTAAQDAARHQDSATTALYIKLAAGEIREAVAQAVARRPAMQRTKVARA
jgi:integrase